MNGQPPSSPAPVALTIDVVPENEAWAVLPDVEELAQRAIAAAVQVSGQSLLAGAELCVALSDDVNVRALNLRWRHIDKSTNVLSFPAAEVDELAAAPHIGDIILAFETVEREARDDDKTLADHTAHLIVHGTLHLLGFDHETEEEAEAMEALEILALAGLGIADPYADRELEK